MLTIISLAEGSPLFSTCTPSIVPKGNLQNQDTSRDLDVQIGSLHAFDAKYFRFPAVHPCYVITVSSLLATHHQ